MSGILRPVSIWKSVHGQQKIARCRQALPGGALGAPAAPRRDFKKLGAKFTEETCKCTPQADFF